MLSPHNNKKQSEYFDSSKTKMRQCASVLLFDHIYLNDLKRELFEVIDLVKEILLR